MHGGSSDGRDFSPFQVEPLTDFATAFRRAWFDMIRALSGGPAGPTMMVPAEVKIERLIP